MCVISMSYLYIYLITNDIDLFPTCWRVDLICLLNRKLLFLDNAEWKLVLEIKGVDVCVCERERE